MPVPEHPFLTWVHSELSRVDSTLNDLARKNAEAIARRNALQDARDKFEFVHKQMPVDPK